MVSNYDFVAYALANYATVQEVREAFASKSLVISEPFDVIAGEFA